MRLPEYAEGRSAEETDQSFMKSFPALGRRRAVSRTVRQRQYARARYVR